jgi:hypothetical protein
VASVVTGRSKLETKRHILFEQNVLRHEVVRRLADAREIVVAVAVTLVKRWARIAAAPALCGSGRRWG